MPQGAHIEKETGERIVAATRQVEDLVASGRGIGKQLIPTSMTAPVRQAIVVGFANPLDRFVQVVEPIFNDSDPWDGGWIIPDDPPGAVWCWPPMRAEDYEDFVLTGGPPDQPLVLMDHMDVLPVIRIRGVWLIIPLIMWGPSKYPDDAEYGDCWQTGGMP